MRILPILAIAAMLSSIPAGARAQLDCGPLEKCEAWVTTYDGPAHGLDTPRNLGYAVQSLASSADGARLFVTGHSFGGDPAAGGTHYDCTTIAYQAASGAELWLARYNGPANSEDDGWAIAVSPDGSRVFVGGGTFLGAAGWDYVTLAYDAATGQELWVSRYDFVSPGTDRAWSMAVSPDGSQVFVTGESWGGPATSGGTHFDYGTVAYDAVTGTQRWVARYDGPANGEDRAYSLAVDRNGSHVYVTGKSSGGTLTGIDFATVAYDAASGAQQWVARYQGLANGYEEGRAVGTSPDGSLVFATGYSSNVLSGDDYTTIAYDAGTGAEVWSALYNGPGNGLDIPYGLAVSHDGERVLVTGQTTGATGSYDYGTVAYEAATGGQQWTAAYNGPPLNNSDVAYAVGVSPDDRHVYVTGESPPIDLNDPYDVATVAYDAASGQQQWLARYSGPEAFQDGAFALAVSPDGSHVYVHGESWHGSTPGVGDYVTIAYQEDLPTSTLLSLASANAEPGLVHLRWSAPRAAQLLASVYRRTPSGAWERLGAPRAEGADRLAYDDRSLPAPGRFAYRLGVEEGGAERFTAETWVDVPRAVRLALEGPSPNPASGNFAVSFSLPTGDPAALRLFDVAGHLVLERGLGILGAGHHTARLAGTGALPAGLYLLRLTQGAGSASAKIVIAR